MLNNKNLLNALEPFADLGMAFIKQGPIDNSPWAQAPDDMEIPLGQGMQGWTVTVGQLRRAYREHRAALKEAKA